MHLAKCRDKALETHFSLPAEEKFPHKVNSCKGSLGDPDDNFKNSLSFCVHLPGSDFL